MIDEKIFEPDLAIKELLPFAFAIVAGVHEDGLSLKFPGEAASVKHYKCNQYCKFLAGQRVFVVKDSGTYVAICPVGNPGEVKADTAAKADIAIAVKNNDDDSPILFSANPKTGNYNMWNNQGLWKRINN